MPLHHRFRQGRHLAVLYMIAAVIPVAVLSWLGLHLLQQDRKLSRPVKGCPENKKLATEITDKQSNLR